MLERYVTTFALRSGGLLGRAVRVCRAVGIEGIERGVSRRRAGLVDDSVLATHPFPEILRVGAGRLGPRAQDLVWERTEHWFDSMVARHHVSSCAAVYCYEHAALSTFEAGGAIGAARIYDQPAAHHATASAILATEAELHPETETPLDRRLRRLAPRRNERKDAELRHADFVIAGSTFTRQSLLAAGVPGARIAVVPLGSPPRVVPRAPVSNAPLVFLSAGLQSVLKGTHYLLEAWKRLRPVGAELWLVGKLLLPERLLKQLPASVILRPPVPHGEMRAIYSRSSVLAFPSLCDGFGMVISEAMAHGLPVITTPHTAGPDLVRDGVEGFLVPIRSVDVLADRIQWCLDNREAVSIMGQRAASAAARWQWPHYRARLASVVSEFLAGWAMAECS